MIILDYFKICVYNILLQAFTVGNLNVQIGGKSC